MLYVSPESNDSGSVVLAEPTRDWYSTSSGQRLTIRTEPWDSAVVANMPPRRQSEAAESVDGECMLDCVECR